MLRQILALDSPQLQALTTIFSQGLHAARNYGGVKPISSTSSDTSRSPRDIEPQREIVPQPEIVPVPAVSASGSKRSASLVDALLDGDNCPFRETTPVSSKRPRLADGLEDVSGAQSDNLASPASGAAGTASSAVLATPLMAPPLTPVAKLLQTLGISHDFPDDSLITSRAPHRRRKGLADACLTRQGNTCVITGSTTGTYQLETAHLLAHSLANLESISVAPYWRLLNIILGPTVTAHIYEIAGGANSYRSSNGIAMNPGLHSSLFDRGIFWLVPHVSDTFDISRSTSYDVELVWRGSKAGMALLVSQLPEDPARQLDRHGFHRLLDAARPIKPGDRFRLQTHDPATYPLPHPLLLDLHALLWDMIASSGIAETDRMKHSRANGETPQRGRRSRGRRGVSSSGSARGGGGRSVGVAETEPDAGPADPCLDASGASRASAANEDSELYHQFGSAGNAYLGLKLQQLLAEQQQDEYYGADDDLSDEYDSNGDSSYEEDPELLAEFDSFRAKMAAKGFYPGERAWAGAGSGAVEQYRRN